MKHTISVLVENEFGVLARVAGLQPGRGDARRAAGGELSCPRGRGSTPYARRREPERGPRHGSAQAPPGASRCAPGTLQVRMPSNV